METQAKEAGLCCGHPVPSRQILKNVFGQALPGELLAIMGPSGSGKSTLLNVLTGRNLQSLNVDGVVLANDENITIQKVKELTGYVQQDTIFIPSLTVTEYLLFQSRFRMGNKVSPKERLKIVEKVIKETELDNCAHTRIGNRYDELVGQGISGGELKRLAFAAALLTNPWVLLCDEPTSGLDSSLAYNVTKKLKSLAQTGRTIIITIHQPSSDVFELFDRILLLKGGDVFFHGTRGFAQQEFQRLGAPCPEHYNPADHYLKVLSNDGTEKYLEAAKDVEKTVITIPKTDEMVRIRDPGTKHIYSSCWSTQFVVLFWRSLLTIGRDPLIMRIKLSQAIGSALILGFAYLNQEMSQRAIQNINGAIFMIVINMTFLNIFSVINVIFSI